MRFSFVALCVFLFFSKSVLSQKNEFGTWNILNLKYKFNNKFSVFGETQIRSLKLYDNFHYSEIKGGFGYYLQKNINLGLGLGSYQTYKEGGNFVLPKNNNEFRIWPQIILIQPISKIKIEQRYRSEFRFTSNGFKNRFRYRLGVSYPFGKFKNNYYPYQISTSNEIFFTNTEPYFERNRFAFTLNYKPSKATNIQVGFLHQFDYKINDETGKNFFQLGYFLELFRKKSSNNISDTNLKDD